MNGSEIRSFSTIYGEQDPREMPAYSITEAAHYLQIPRSTLRAWSVGRPYDKKVGTGFFQPLFSLPNRPEKDPPLLSFLNLIEAHVLSALRRSHRIVLEKVRDAITYLEQQFPSLKHPLAHQQFVTDGIDLFIEKYGYLINSSRQGQLAMYTVLQAHLSRIDHDPTGVPLKLYLFTRTHRPDEPRVVVIDPYVSFGRPVLAGTGIPTAIIAERYKAGESIQALADDYGRSSEEIEEAIRCELHSHTA